LRKVWRDKISFVNVDVADPDKVPVNPRTVLLDDIAFKRATQEPPLRTLQ
jgi:hypothetical protein